MVQLKTALVGLLSIFTISPSVVAFTPQSQPSIVNGLLNGINGINPAAKKVELARAKVQDEYRKMADMDMKMVAGGAQAEEYYEG